MKTTNQILESAIATIINEGQSILDLQKLVNDDFADVVNEILNSSGRIIVTGVGKSANIAQKIVSTFNSTGQPSVFMHAADASHGDLGNIQENDVVLCLSKSGNTSEIKAIVPLIKSMGNKIIALCGNKDSFLVSHSDWFLNSYVEKEACPNNLAPTTSTTAQLVLGDALAVCLLESRNFSDKDFARFHPGGSLGKRLFLKMSDLCNSEHMPKVDVEDSMYDVIVEISQKRLGATIVMSQQEIVGIITDGDIRRIIEKKLAIDSLRAKDVMNNAPKTIQKDNLAIEGLKIMEKNTISQLVVLDGTSYVGIVHIHDMLKEGIL